MDVDSISATVRVIAEQIGRKNFEVPLRDGSIRQGAIHDHWKDGCSAWRGKTIDLQAAYKQMIVKESALWSSVIVLYDPASKAPRLFIQNTLPFGAAASVLHFNRVARSSWWLGVCMFAFAG